MEKKLEDLLANASFVRWIRREATPEEEKYWDTWKQKNSGSRQIIEEAETILDAYRQEEVDIPDSQVEWLKLENALDKDEQQSKIHHLRNERHHFRKSKRFVAVAILIIGACLGAFLVYQYQVVRHFEDSSIAGISHSQEYRTDYGEKVTFRLNDNSRIVLNANSHIKFSESGSGGLNTQNVWLEGEAYFDIRNHSDVYKRTFTVYTLDGSVSVLGTRFAVKTLEGETRAVLEEGEILVELPSENPGTAPYDESGVILKPGDMAKFSAGNENIRVSQVNPRVYTSWNEDIWVFDDTPVSEIAGRIEDTFGFEVFVAQEYRERKISGSINSADLNVLKKALSAILSASIEQQGQTLYIHKGNQTQTFH